MSKSKKITVVAIFLCVLGLILSSVGLFVMGFDFTRLNLSEFVEREYVVIGDFSKLELESQICDVTFALSEDGECKVVTYSPENINYVVFENEGVLTFYENDARKWYEFIGVNIGTAKATVYLPKKEYGDLIMESDTGNAHLPEDLTFSTVKINTDTGNVRINSNVTEIISAETDTGDITVLSPSTRYITAKSDTGNIEISGAVVQRDVTAESDTGNVHLTGVRCENIVCNTSTGNMIFADTVAELTARFSTDTGNIRFDGSDATDIYAQTSTGDVTGSLLSDKIFFAQSDTGNTDVPRTTNGGVCDVKSDTGNIKLSISPFEK